MSTDIEFLDHVYHRLRSSLREALDDWDEDFHALDIGMALGMLICEVGWDAGRATMPKESLMQKVKSNLRILENDDATPL